MSRGRAFGLFFLVLLVSRKPEILLHAELWGDDGWSWYPDAYTSGLSSLLIPVNGYLNTLQRLAGLAVQPFPLAWVPTLFASVGLLVQILPAVFLISPRMASAWPNRWARLLFALIFIALPNDIELYANLTNAQWNFALLAFLVLVSAPPNTTGEKFFDAFVLLLSGLSGPFCILLAPIAIWQIAENRDRTSMWRAGFLGAAALIQLGFILGTPHGGRSTAPLGAGPRMFARIVALQIILGAELGYYTIATMPPLAIWQNNVLPITIAILALILTLCVLPRGSRLLLKISLFASLVFIAAMARPQASLTQPQWPMLSNPPMGNRYYVFPMIAWIGVVFTLAADRNRILRNSGMALLLIILIWGIPHDWQELPMPRTDFVARARAFEVAPPGTRMEFPIHPPGLSPMILVKRAP